MTTNELLLSITLQIGAIIELLDRKDVLSKQEFLAEIKSLQQQLAKRTNELPEQQQAFPQPYLNVQVENALGRSHPRTVQRHGADGASGQKSFGPCGEAD